MLVFNIGRVLNLRGIERHYSYLCQIGFTHMTATKIVAGKTSAPKIEHIELLCRALNCTPNDLFEWIPDENGIAENHQLNTLRRDETKGLSDLIKGISLDKLSDVEEFLKDLNKK